MSRTHCSLFLLLKCYEKKEKKRKGEYMYIEKLRGRK